MGINIGIIGIGRFGTNYFKTFNKLNDAEVSWICSRNDLYGNVSVIGAGILVGYFNSMWPDIIVGLGIAVLVLYFSVMVIKESLAHTQ